MRKLLAIALIFTMCIGMTACGNNTTAEPTTAPTTAPTAAPTEAPAGESDLVLAKNYLQTMYKDSTVTTPADYIVVGVINIGGKLFEIEWTADSDTVKFVRGEDKMVTVDIDEKNPEELSYVLTATLTDGTNKESVSFEHKVPAYVDLSGGASYADIVDAAYKLEDGLAMDTTQTLYGTVTKIDTPWSADYKNISVVITIAGKEDKPILCYRLAGEGAENLKEGDAITVTGILKNYKGTIEFDKGCTLDGYGEIKDYTAILDACYKLEDGASMTEPLTMSGVITKIDTPYSADYKNITVIMVVNDKEEQPIMCYRLQGEGAETLAVGDYITVTGIVKNYKGTIEFDAKCNLDNVVKADGSAAAPAVDWAAQYVGDYQAQIIDAATFANCTEGFTLTFNFARLDTYPYWNFTFINNTDGWPKLLDAKYYDVRPAFSEWDFIDVNDTSVTSYTATFTKDAVAELMTAGGLGIQVYGIVAHDIVVTPLAAPVDPTGMTADQILDAAYGLADGAAFTAPCTLTGVISEINSEYSEQYGNITVTIVVNGKEDKKIECFRLVGDGIATLAVGDTVTVTGIMKNYKGKIEFDAKCNLDAVVKAEGEAPAATTASTGIDLTAGLVAGTDYNGISVLEDMTWKEGNVEVDGVAYTGSVAGKNNPSPKNGAVPTEGAAVKVTPAANGTFKVVFKLNAGKTYHVVDADGNSIDTGSNDGGESQYLAKSYTVEAGKTYYIYGDGTKLPFYFLGLE